MTPEEGRRHLRYSAWATRRVLDAVMQLPEAERVRETGVSHRSLAGTLDHIVFGDRVWIERISGTNAPVSAESTELAWIAIQQRWADWAASVSEEDLARVIDYKDLRGAVRRSTACEIVMHVVNHATLHRGQILAMLRQIGVAPPQVDLITFYREEQQQGNAHA